MTIQILLTISKGQTTYEIPILKLTIKDGGTIQIFSEVEIIH